MLTSWKSAMVLAAICLAALPDRYAVADARPEIELVELGERDFGQPNLQHAPEENMFIVQDGFVVQHKEYCPQAISNEDAAIMINDGSDPGQVVELRSLRGRTGNHFEALSSIFSVAFCCQAKVLTLPNRDIRFPTENHAIFRPNVQHFSFSTRGAGDTRSVYEPLLAAGYADLANRTDVCPPELIINGDGNHLVDKVGIHVDLQRCINSVVARGCESVYLHNSFAGCPQDSNTTAIRRDGDFDERKAQEDSGSLVVHIRSGDVFKGSRWTKYGQPPLSYYLEVMRSRPWNSTTILTNAENLSELHPAFRLIEAINKDGLIGGDVRTFKNRGFYEDLHTMLCADNLALAVSSLSLYLMAHTRAKRIFMPTACGPPAVQHSGKADPMPQLIMTRDPFNTALLCVEKPDAEVYGVVWNSSKEAYTPATEWKNTPDQRLEMIFSDEIVGLERCCVQI